jgi:hypothetical protein
LQDDRGRTVTTTGMVTCGSRARPVLNVTSGRSSHRSLLNEHREDVVAGKVAGKPLDRRLAVVTLRRS